VLVERGQHIRAIDLTRPATGPLKPAGDRRSRRDPRRLGPEEFGDRHASLGSTPDQAGVHVVVEIADLDRLGHAIQSIMQIRMSLCKSASTVLHHSIECDHGTM
jgi:hypothetical protein